MSAALRILLGLAVVALTAGTGWAQDQTPAGSPERGKQLYVELACHACHGTHGQGGERGAGPKIFPDPFPWPLFLQQVRKPRRDMPAYTPSWVSDQDVADMYAYLRSLKPGPPGKDIPLLRP